MRGCETVLPGSLWFSSSALTFSFASLARSSSSSFSLVFCSRFSLSLTNSSSKSVWLAILGMRFTLRRPKKSVV